MKFKRIAALLMASVMTAGAASAISASAAKKGYSAPYSFRVMKGDINGDIRIDIEDCVAVNNYVHGIAPIRANRVTAADVNWDGKIDIWDVQLINNYINGRATIKHGNVLGNSYVTNEDLEAIMDHINGVSPLTKAEQKRADINNDKKVDIEDAVLLSNYLYK